MEKIQYWNEQYWNYNSASSDVANMESVNNARACKHAYLYTNNNISKIFLFKLFMKWYSFVFIYNSL